MTTPFKRTKGEWLLLPIRDYADSPLKLVLSEDPTIGIAYHSGPHYFLKEGDARFIAMAGTIAHQLDSMGYDGEKAIEALPHILDHLETLSGRGFCDDHCSELADSRVKCHHQQASELLNSLKP